MSVGIQITKGEIDSRMGQMARNFQGVFVELGILKGYFDATADPDIVALGYTTQEVAVMKSAIADLHQLNQIVQGQVNLPVAKNFTTFLRQLWGVGAD